MFLFVFGNHLKEKSVFLFLYNNENNNDNCADYENSSNDDNGKNDTIVIGLVGVGLVGGGSSGVLGGGFAFGRTAYNGTSDGKYRGIKTTKNSSHKGRHS